MYQLMPAPKGPRPLSFYKGGQRYDNIRTKYVVVAPANTNNRKNYAQQVQEQPFFSRSRSAEPRSRFVENRRRNPRQPNQRAPRQMPPNMMMQPSPQRQPRQRRRRQAFVDEPRPRSQPRPSALMPRSVSRSSLSGNNNKLVVSTTNVRRNNNNNNNRENYDGRQSFVKYRGHDYRVLSGAYSDRENYSVILAGKPGTHKGFHHDTNSPLEYDVSIFMHAAAQGKARKYAMPFKNNDGQVKWAAISVAIHVQEDKPEGYTKVIDGADFGKRALLDIFGHTDSDVLRFVSPPVRKALRFFRSHMAELGYKEKFFTSLNLAQFDRALSLYVSGTDNVELKEYLKSIVLKNKADRAKPRPPVNKNAISSVAIENALGNVARRVSRHMSENPNQRIDMQVLQNTVAFAHGEKFVGCGAVVSVNFGEGHSDMNAILTAKHVSDVADRAYIAHGTPEQRMIMLSALHPHDKYEEEDVIFFTGAALDDICMANDKINPMPFGPASDMKTSAYCMSYQWTSQEAADQMQISPVLSTFQMSENADSKCWLGKSGSVVYNDGRAVGIVTTSGMKSGFETFDRCGITYLTTENEELCWRMMGGKLTPVCRKPRNSSFFALFSMALLAVTMATFNLVPNTDRVIVNSPAAASVHSKWIYVTWLSDADGEQRPKELAAAGVAMGLHGIWNNVDTPTQKCTGDLQTECNDDAAEFASYTILNWNIQTENGTNLNYREHEYRKHAFPHAVSPEDYKVMADETPYSSGTWYVHKCRATPTQNIIQSMSSERLADAGFGCKAGLSYYIRSPTGMLRRVPSFPTAITLGTSASYLTNPVGFAYGDLYQDSGFVSNVVGSMDFNTAALLGTGTTFVLNLATSGFPTIMIGVKSFNCTEPEAGSPATYRKDDLVPGLGTEPPLVHMATKQTDFQVPLNKFSHQLAFVNTVTMGAAYFSDTSAEIMPHEFYVVWASKGTATRIPSDSFKVVNTQYLHGNISIAVNPIGTAPGGSYSPTFSNIYGVAGNLARAAGGLHSTYSGTSYSGFGVRGATTSKNYGFQLPDTDRAAIASTRGLWFSRFYIEDISHEVAFCNIFSNRNFALTLRCNVTSRCAGGGPLYLVQQLGIITKRLRIGYCEYSNGVYEGVNLLHTYNRTKTQKFGSSGNDTNCVHIPMNRVAFANSQTTKGSFFSTVSNAPNGATAMYTVNKLVPDFIPSAVNSTNGEYNIRGLLGFALLRGVEAKNYDSFPVTNAATEFTSITTYPLNYESRLSEVEVCVPEPRDNIRRYQNTVEFVAKGYYIVASNTTIIKSHWDTLNVSLTHFCPDTVVGECQVHVYYGASPYQHTYKFYMTNCPVNTTNLRLAYARQAYCENYSVYSTSFATLATVGSSVGGVLAILAAFRRLTRLNLVARVRAKLTRTSTDPHKYAIVEQNKKKPVPLQSKMSMKSQSKFTCCIFLTKLALGAAQQDTPSDTDRATESYTKLVALANYDSLRLIVLVLAYLLVALVCVGVLMRVISFFFCSAETLVSSIRSCTCGKKDMLMASLAFVLLASAAGVTIETQTVVNGDGGPVLNAKVVYLESLQVGKKFAFTLTPEAETSGTNQNRQTDNQTPQKKYAPVDVVIRVKDIYCNYSATFDYYAYDYDVDVAGTFQCCGALNCGTARSTFTGNTKQRLDNCATDTYSNPDVFQRTAFWWPHCFCTDNNYACQYATMCPEKINSKPKIWVYNFATTRTVVLYEICVNGQCEDVSATPHAAEPTLSKDGFGIKLGSAVGIHCSYDKRLIEYNGNLYEYEMPSYGQGKPGLPGDAVARTFGDYPDTIIAGNYRIDKPSSLGVAVHSVGSTGYHTFVKLVEEKVILPISWSKPGVTYVDKSDVWNSTEIVLSQSGMNSDLAAFEVVFDGYSLETDKTPDVEVTSAKVGSIEPFSDCYSCGAKTQVPITIEAKGSGQLFYLCDPPICKDFSLTYLPGQDQYNISVNLQKMFTHLCVNFTNQASDFNTCAEQTAALPKGYVDVNIAQAENYMTSFSYADTLSFGSTLSGGIWANWWLYLIIFFLVALIVGAVALYIYSSTRRASRLPHKHIFVPVVFFVFTTAIIVAVFDSAGLGPSGNTLSMVFHYTVSTLVIAAYGYFIHALYARFVMRQVAFNRETFWKSITWFGFFVFIAVVVELVLCFLRWLVDLF